MVDLRVYEVVAAGLGDDITDDRVFWVAAESDSQVRRALREAGCGEFCGIVGALPQDADYDLTQVLSRQHFVTKLRKLSVMERAS